MTQQNERRRKSLTHPMYRFDEPGKTLIGKVIEKDSREYEGRTRGRYLIEDDDGKTWLVYGTAQLDDALSQAEDGIVVEIVYTGIEESASGYPVKQFEVYELE